MKQFNIIWALMTALLLALGMSGCGKKEGSWQAPETMHWDRDMCYRCKMAISDRKFAAQIVDPASHKHYKFDDIGCAIKWLQEEKVPWKDRAIIWVSDAKTGRWIDARKAYWAEGKITPMGFGFAAYANKADAGDKPLAFEAVVKRIEAMKRHHKKMH